MSSKKSLNSSKKVQNILYKYDDVKSLLDVSKATFYNYKKQGLLDLKIREAKNKQKETLNIEIVQKKAQQEIKEKESLSESIQAMILKGGKPRATKPYIYSNGGNSPFVRNP